jgi:hypothetical protein
MKLKTHLLFAALLLTIIKSSAQEYETCGFSEDAWSGDTAAITAFLIPQIMTSREKRHLVNLTTRPSR